ncbi:MAG: hypothetical protein JNM86_12840 [Phycisphaerae bacterium]|nr:hypothetical protein [Phycisphaerae bacterium]
MRNSGLLGASMAMMAAATALKGAEGVHPITTLYVDQRAPEGGNGQNWEGAFRDLQDALNNATTIVPLGPSWKERLIEIRIAQGTYKPAGPGGDRDRCFEASGQPMMSSPVLSLRGSFAGLGAADPDRQDFVSTATVLSGDLNGDDGPGWTNRGDNSRTILRVERVLHGYFEAEGIEFRGASDVGSVGTDKGGAVRLFVTGFSSGELGQARISNCRFAQNETFTSDGAGLHVVADTLVLDASEFASNRSVNGKGGGVFLGSYLPGWASVRGCAFLNNAANHGGGIFLTEMCWVEGSRFLGNSAARFGGAIYAASDAKLNSVLLVKNSAGLAGGALFSGASEMLGVSMTTFASNAAPAGAAIDAQFAPLAMYASIVWDSRPAVGGHAIDLGFGIFQSWITGAIIQGGEASIAHEPGSLVLGQAIVDADPMFIRAGTDTESDWTLWNYRPRFQSPAAMMSKEMNGLLQDLDGVNYGCSLPWNSFDAGCYFVDSCVCWANLNSDWEGLVNDEDFALFVEAYNTMVTPEALPRADLNRDGAVDDADFSLFVAAYDSLLCS